METNRPAGVCVITRDDQGTISVKSYVTRDVSEQVLAVMSDLAKSERAIRYQELAQAYRDFAELLCRDLHDFAAEVISFLRWRHSIGGGHRAIKNEGGTFWRSDDGTWQRMFTPMSVVVRPGRLVVLSEQAVTRLAAMWNDAIREPLGHELWREAWAIRDSAPRSAVMVGIAAFEVGVKQWITRQVPETDWLMRNVPSPPAVSMLDDYVPRLVRLKGRPDRARRLPKQLVTTLHRGVKLRNEIAHTGADNPIDDDLRELLEAVRDALYLLDYLGGRDWALEHIRPDTAANLRVPEDEPGPD
jgi:hypothetical protein